MGIKLPLVAGLILTAVSGQSFGAPVTFFGEDVNGPAPSNTTLDPATAPFTNAEAAQASFFSNLNAVGTESFESFSSTPTLLIFPGASFATQTHSGSAVLASGNDGFGRYPHSGDKYLSLQNANFTLTFPNPGIAAFGFFATDVGDVGGHLILTLIDVNNNTTVLTIPNTTSQNQEISGSNFYFGFFDTANMYKQIVLSNSLGSDGFGVDDISVQVFVAPSNTPVPAALPLFASGAGVFGFLGWRRKRKLAASA